MKGVFWNLGVRGKQVPVSKLLASGGTHPWPQPEVAWLWETKTQQELWMWGLCRVP